MPGALPAHSEPSPKLQNRHWVEFRCKNRCRQAQRIAAVITEGLEICVGSIRGQRFLDVESPFVGNRCNIDSLFVQDFPQGRVCFFEPRESPGSKKHTLPCGKSCTNRESILQRLPTNGLSTSRKRWPRMEPTQISRPSVITA